MTSALPWMSIVIAGCTVDVADRQGRLCDASRPCANGRLCLSGMCADPGPGWDGQGACALVTTAQPNLIGNSSFEASTEGWDPYPDTQSAHVQRASGGFADAFALEVTGLATSTVDELGVNDTPNWIMSTPAAGTRYCVAAWVRGDTATGSAILHLREYAPSGTMLGVSVRSPLAPFTSQWQAIAVEYDVLALDSNLDLHILDQSGAAGDVFWIDEVSVRAVP